MGNIKFDFFPVYPLQFAILEIESKKLKDLWQRARLSGAPSVFLGVKLGKTGGTGRGAMSKKAKSKADKKKPAKKSGAKKSKKELNPGEVRKDISRMVESEAATMAQAAINEGKKGQLAPLRYLLEVANIFPGATDGSEATEDEDSLARTLLKRMGIPDLPVVRADDDDEPTAASCGDGVAAAAGEDKRTGSEEERKEPVG